MNRTAVNPWDWSLQFGFNQGEMIEKPSRILFCAGQTSIDGSGKAVSGDMKTQMKLSLDNLEAVLAKGGMSLSNVVRLTVYTTDVDATLASFGTPSGRLGEAGVKPAQTLLGVSRLAFPELLIELEATAVA